MINGLGILGWGVGGIEAEAAMLGQPISMLIPEVVGFPPHGQAAGRRHRHRPGADRHPDAAQEGRGGQVRRVLRRRPGQACPWPTAPPSPTWPRNTAPPVVSSRWTSETLNYMRLSGREDEHHRAGGSLHQGPGPVARFQRSPTPSSPMCWSWTWPPCSRPWPVPSARRTGWP